MRGAPQSFRTNASRINASRAACPSQGVASLGVDRALIRKPNGLSSREHCLRSGGVGVGCVRVPDHTVRQPLGRLLSRCAVDAAEGCVRVPDPEKVAGPPCVCTLLKPMYFNRLTQPLLHQEMRCTVQQSSHTHGRGARSACGGACCACGGSLSLNRNVDGM